MAYIYMVRCQDESLYTGIAHDVGKRMREHYYKKKTGAKYTKKPSGDSSGDGLADGNHGQELPGWNIRSNSFEKIRRKH